MAQDIIIRRSKGSDKEAIERLAELDSHSAPEGQVLMAFVDGEPRAALPLDGGEPVADPFHRTAEVVDLLRLRATQAESPTTHRRSRHLPRLGRVQGNAA